MLARRLYSSFSRGSGSLRAGHPLAPAAGAPSSPSSSRQTATRGRFKPTRNGRSRALSFNGSGSGQAATSTNAMNWVSELQLQRGPFRVRNVTVNVGGGGSTALGSKAFGNLDIEMILRGESSGAPSRSQTSTRGRKRPFSRQTSRPAPTILSPIVQHPIAKDFSFRPIPLSPIPLHQHIAFNPPHVPIPANLGTALYDRPRRTLSAEEISSSLEGLFSPPPPPSPSGQLTKASESSSSGLGDHLSVLSALSHPLHAGSLYTPPSTATDSSASSPSFTTYASIDPEGHLVRTLAEADTKNQLMAERSFNKILEQLGGATSTDTASVAGAGAGQVENSGETEMNQVLSGVEALLSKLKLQDESESEMVTRLDGTEVDVQVDMVGEDGIWMDSVKRKRKKKISKHKYKKRRKAQRAQRKKLGK